MKSRTVASLILVFSCLAVAQTNPKNQSKPGSDEERFIGAWHLESLQAPDADGRMIRFSGLIGTLVYTRDSHMSVQIMYPPSATALTNDYVLNGYEASFGRYEVDPAKQTITHFVEGSITRGLVGKSLVRVYRFTQDGGRLTITSPRPDERWSVTWAHD